MATLLCAAWVAPMDRPPFRDGAVLLEGAAIHAVGPAADVRRAWPGVLVEDFGEAVILPGLVNPHTHLELSHLAPPAERRSFTDWLTTVIGSAGDAAAAGEAIRAGATESLQCGVTCVGDIARHVGVAREALRRSPLRAVSFGEVVGMAKRKAGLDERLAAAVGTPTDPAAPARGVSPHAPYSIDADGYRRCLAAAGRLGLPLTTHLAESGDESRFLSDHAGPFRALWDRLGAWDDDAVPRFAGGPVRYAASLGLLDYHPTALAHVNYCDDDEMALLAKKRASVVYCPRTHAYFDHPPHRWREMLAAGINVAVGTDSRASSPDLNLVEDLRLLHRLAPDFPAPALWEMATARAAVALGLGDTIGSLTIGKAADVVVFPASGTDPLAEVLESTAQPIKVWAGGRLASVNARASSGSARG